jgi:hypothetical protein
MLRAMRLLLTYAAVVALTACNAVLGLEERPARETPSSVGAGATSGSTGAGDCGVACIADVASGWSGPTAVVRGDASVACGSAHPNPEVRLFDELSAEPAQCMCACEPAQGIDCSASPVVVAAFDDESCQDPENAPSGVVGDCVDLCCGVDSANFVPATPDVSGASCAPTTVADSAPAPTWARHLIGCGPVESMPCAGGDCFAAVADGASLCIHRSGDHPCPDGPFSERELWYADFLDDRACATCGCGDVEGASCNEVVVGYSNESCTNDPVPLVPSPQCAIAAPSFGSAHIESVDPVGTCTPTGGTPMGEATPADPTTVCCVR